MRRGRKAPRGPRQQERPISFLVQKRIEKGLTQDQLSKAIGIDRTYLSRIERKERQMQTLPWDLVSLIAKAIDCTPDVLVAAMK